MFSIDYFAVLSKCDQIKYVFWKVNSDFNYRFINKFHIAY